MLTTGRKEWNSPASSPSSPSSVPGTRKQKWIAFFSISSPDFPVPLHSFLLWKNPEVRLFLCSCCFSMTLTLHAT